MTLTCVRNTTFMQESDATGNLLGNSISCSMCEDPDELISGAILANNHRGNNNL